MSRLLRGPLFIPLFLLITLPSWGQVINPDVSLTGTNVFTGTNIFNGTTTAVTQPISDVNSTRIATDQFVQNIVAATSSSVPVSSVTGGTYSFASIGTGAAISYTTTGGAITAITSIVSGGTGYLVGDVLTVTAGNLDNYLLVTSAPGGIIATLTILYGGTAIPNGTNPLISSAFTYPRSFELSGTLTSPVTIIAPSGPYLTSGAKFLVYNNTTGAFVTTAYLSNGSDAPSGPGVVINQGTSFNNPIFLNTDGVNGIFAVSPQPLSIAQVGLANTFTQPQTFSAGITGTTSGTAATAGTVGEVISNLKPVGSAVSLATSGTTFNVLQVSLTSGDWDVMGSINYSATSATTLVTSVHEISFNSGTGCSTPALLTDGSELYVNPPVLTAATAKFGASLATKQYNVSTTTTVCITVVGSFTGGSEAAYGSLIARRRR